MTLVLSVNALAYGLVNHGTLPSATRCIFSTITVGQLPGFPQVRATFRDTAPPFLGARFLPLQPPPPLFLLLLIPVFMPPLLIIIF